MSIMNEIKNRYGVIADTDTYKLTHHPQYVPGASRMMSYIESRGGKYDKVVWFGLQLIIKEHLTQKLTHEQVDNMMEFVKAHLGGNYAPELETAFRTVVDEYDGYMPVRIRAAAEGLVIPVKNVLAVIETTVDDPRVFSLVSYLETRLLRVWAPTTVATTSYHIRQDIYRGLEETADDPDAEIAIKLHDFGGRGISTAEGAAFAGAGHLVSFMGTDTLMAIHAANIGYGAEMAGISVPATEHSTTTSHGRYGEMQMIGNTLEKFGGEGKLVSTVADSYDIKAFLEEIVPAYKDKIIQDGTTWVVRPDSGDAVEMPVAVIKKLEETFGTEVNNKGYKVLNNVRVIQGDGLDAGSVRQIIERLIEEGYSVSNIVFGMGGGLLQKNDRDTQKFAMKACAIYVDGEWKPVYKNPAIYDPQWNKIGNDKASKKGRLTLMRKNGEYTTITEEETAEYIQDGYEEVLETVFENGHIVKEFTFDEVRGNAGTF